MGMWKMIMRRRAILIGVFAACAVSAGLVVAAAGGSSVRHEPAAASGDLLSGHPGCAVTSGKAQACADAFDAEPKSAPVPKSTYSTAPPGTAGPAYFQQGIEETAQSEVPGLNFVQQNIWYGEIRGTDTGVGAGSVENVTTQAGTSVGELVEVPSPDGSARPLTVQKSSVEGPFAIVKASDDILTIEGANGATFKFDAATGEIVS